MLTNYEMKKKIKKEWKPQKPSQKKQNNVNQLRKKTSYNKQQKESLDQIKFKKYIKNKNRLLLLGGGGRCKVSNTVVRSSNIIHGM